MSSEKSKIWAIFLPLAFVIFFQSVGWANCICADQQPSGCCEQQPTRHSPVTECCLTLLHHKDPCEPWKNCPHAISISRGPNILWQASYSQVNEITPLELYFTIDNNGRDFKQYENRFNLKERPIYPYPKIVYSSLKSRAPPM